MKQVLFICVGNSARSVMAEAFFNALAGGRARALSAGTRPAKAVSPIAVAAMAEVGIDISHHRPRPLTQELIRQADLIIGMGCGVVESCPRELNLTLHEDWGLEETLGRGLEEVRAIRDEIRRRVEALLEGMGP